VSAATDGSSPCRNVVSIGDTDRDKGDVVWRNSANVSSNLSGTVPSNWTVAGTGDYNGDHKADILLRYDAGTVTIWDMKDDNILSSNSLGTVPADWHIIV
jgi:hypothetical protein